MKKQNTDQSYELYTLLESIPSDISVQPVSHTTYGLTVYPLQGQQVQDKISIRPRTMGLVRDGMETYLEEYGIDSHDIASTYSSWDDEFATDQETYSEPVFEGGIGGARDAEEYRQFAYKSKYVRAGVRILNGEGRFSADEFTFHSAVPLSLLEHEENGVVAIAPVDSLQDTEPKNETNFTYTADGGDDFSMNVR